MSAVIDHDIRKTGGLAGFSGRTVAWIGWFGLIGLGFALTQPSLATASGLLVAVSVMTAGLLVAALAQAPGGPLQRKLRRALCAVSPLLLGSMLWLATFLASTLAGPAGLPFVVLASLVLFAAAVIAELAFAAAVAVLLARSVCQMPALVVAALVADRFCGLLGETR